MQSKEEGTTAEILDLVDLDELRKEVREKYREVAQDPTAEYHFRTRRALCASSRLSRNPP
jgi:uncharacterized protein YbcC (UPF0753/DUF2309 family)